jgi:hypothetical protein
MPAMFGSDEIVEVDGSPLLKSIFENWEKGKLVFEAGNKVETDIVLSAVDFANHEKVTLYGIKGRMWTAAKLARFEGGIKESPLFFEFTFPIPPCLGNNHLTFNLRFDSSVWSDIPVLRLPHFKKLKEFFAAIHAGCLLPCDYKWISLCFQNL